MAKSANQKLKLLYLLRFLTEHTDENHALTMAQLLQMLRQFGIDVETTQSRTTGYYLASRRFEMPELKLLVDAVQSSKFITSKKSVQLIGKIEQLTSRYEAT